MELSERIMKKVLGVNTTSPILSAQGASKFMNMPSSLYEPQNPLSRSGKKVMSSMKAGYGAKKGKNVFYATMNKKNMKNKWEK